MATIRKPPARAGKTPRSTSKSATAVRDRRGQVVPSVTAAELKNRTGAVLAGALSHGTVAIHRHGKIHALLLSFDEYQALLKHAPAPAKTLEKEFEKLLAKMRSRRGVQAALSLFNTTPEDLGQSAHKTAKKRAR